MYKFITKTENIGSFDFYNGDIIIINKKKDNPYLALLDDNLNKKVKIDDIKAYDFIINNNNIIVTNKKSSESYSPAGASVPLVNTRKIKYVH